MYFELQVSGSSDLFCGKPLQIDLDQHGINSHQLRQSQPHHHRCMSLPGGVLKRIEKKDFINPGTAKGLLQPAPFYINGTLQHPVGNNECDRLFSKPERLHQASAYQRNGNNNSCINGGGGISGSNTVTSSFGSSKIQEDQLASQNQQHECGQCGKLFCSIFHLGRHVKIHSGEKAFLCSQCEQSFHRKDHLKTHEKTHQNSNEKAVFECERMECGKTYNSYASYMKHRKSHEIADASLGVGGGVGSGGMKQMLSSNGSMVDIKHKNNLTAATGSSTQQLGNDSIDTSPTMTTAPPVTSCSTGVITTNTSSSSAATTPSRRPHREQGEKRFQCMQCSKKFPTSKDLKRHDVVHTGRYMKHEYI